jgi:hypothetical protein
LAIFDHHGARPSPAAATFIITERGHPCPSPTGRSSLACDRIRVYASKSEQLFISPLGTCPKFSILT